MADSFAEEFKALRRKKQINQAALAFRAGLGTRTIGGWETGQNLPRIPELEAALTALQATAEERLRLLGHVTPSRGQRAARAAAASHSPENPGAWADSGDLLRAIRLRQGLTQEQAAAQIGVRRTTLLDWEKGKHALSDDSLERFCAALGVFPEEKEALLSGGLLLADGKREWTLEECEAQTRYLHQAVNANNAPLMDLYSLALKRQLRLQTAHPDKALHLLGSVELYHAYWLYLRNREAEGQAAINRAMTCMQKQGKPEFYWTGVLNRASFQMTERLGHLKGGLVVYRQWAARLPETAYRLFPLCDAARHMAAGGDAATAQSLLADAERLVPIQTQKQAQAERHFDTTCVSITMQTRLSEAALQWLLKEAVTTPQRIKLHTEWIMALWNHGETREAAQAFAVLTQQHPDAVSLPYAQRCAALFS